MNYVEETLQQLSRNWFLSEPAYFALYCQQHLLANVRMECPIRCGAGRIEYNPLLLAHKNYDEIEQLMRIELIRLYLKHPYERRPEGCCNEAIAVGSDITIADGYCLLRHEKLPLRTPDFYHLPLGQYYEWYAKQIQNQRDEKDEKDERDEENENNENNDNNDNNAAARSSLSAKSELWEHDSLMCQRINELIERTTDWGSIPADIVERIQASTHARINNRDIWQGFHSAILSSQRRLTRMRPNRRTGFVQMGSRREFDTHLLVAIDVSGSIDDRMLDHFFSTVNHLFRYGNVQIDLCQFDAEMGPVVPLTRTRQQYEIQGRGGTSFQPVIDYALEHDQYDGLLILTDGKAPAPQWTSRRRLALLWVCHDRDCYLQCKSWMQQTGRCCYLTL